MGLQLICCCCCCLQEATNNELNLIQTLGLHTRPNDQGCTALHYAAAAHKPKLVQQLLELRADVDATVRRAFMSEYLTPLHMACLGRVESDKQMDGLLCAVDDIFAVKVSCCGEE
jgi:ankyrin repeat protein